MRSAANTGSLTCSILLRASSLSTAARRGWPSPYHQDAMHNDTRQDILCFGSTSYQHYPVNQWTSTQVQEWLRTICLENHLDPGNLASFADCTGSQLCAMNHAHFVETHPLYGDLFFRKFREYIDHFQRQDRSYRHHLHHQHDHHHHHQHQHHYHHPNSPPTAPASPYIGHDPATPTTYQELLARPQPAIYQPSCVPWQDPSSYHHNSYPGNSSSSYTTEGTLPPTSGDFAGPGHNPMGVYPPGYSLPFDCPGDSTPSPPSASLPMPPPGYLPVGHMPTGASPSSPSPSPLSPLPGQQDTRRDRGPKLWEFLLDLLEDPASNPAIIRWENQEERTFRLTSPHEVSLRWGQRRPNQNSLPYDYFARALRYHYKTGMLISVPERKLVYKFGSLVFQQRRRGTNSLMFPESPHADTSGHPS